MSDPLACCPEITAHGWKWPLDLSRYDRSPYLTEAEQTEIHAWRQGVEAGKTHWYDRTHRLLQRLLLPIHNALDVAQPHRTATRSSVIGVILREMDARQTSYWHWGQAQWLQIFGNNHKRFNKHYSTPMDTRSYLLAVSYLLCGFDSLHATGPFNQPFFAAKVFGQPAVDEAVDRIQKELLRWGWEKTRLFGLSEMASPSSNVLPVYVST